MQADEVRRRAGITARQLDTWTTSGLLKVQGRTLPGSGVPRDWPEAEVEVARRIAHLLEAGFTLKKAAELARLENGLHPVTPRVEVLLAL